MKITEKNLKKDHIKRILLADHSAENLVYQSIIRNNLLSNKLRKHIFNDNHHNYVKFTSQSYSQFLNDYLQGSRFRVTNKSLLHFNKIDKNNKKMKRVYKLIRKTQIRNRCIYTGRSRGILPKYGVSRIMFRHLVENGYIPGFN